MALMPVNLRVEAPDGSFQEEYRIHGGDIEWLRHRIGWRRLVLACTDQHTLETFGVSANSDRNHRYHA